MAERGRPTKLTPAIQQKIYDTIRAGNYLETAAAFAGVDVATVRRWVKRGERELELLEAGEIRKIRKKEEPFADFCAAIKKAQAEGEARAVLVISNAAQQDWKAAAWRLERMYPERWGRKDRLSAELQHSGEVGLEIVVDYGDGDDG